MGGCGDSVAQPNARLHRRGQHREVVRGMQARQAIGYPGALHRHGRWGLKLGIAQHLFHHLSQRNLVAQKIETGLGAVVEDAPSLLRWGHDGFDRFARVQRVQVVAYRVVRLQGSSHRRPVPDHATKNSRLVLCGNLLRKYRWCYVVPAAYSLRGLRHRHPVRPSKNPVGLLQTRQKGF